MRARRAWVLALTLVLLSGSVSACNFLRTPYERQKISEKEGQAKQGSDKGGDAEASGGKEKEGEQKEGGGEQSGDDKKAGGGAKTAGGGGGEGKQDKSKQQVDPKRAETYAEREERLKGQGVLYVLPGLNLAKNIDPSSKKGEQKTQQAEEGKAGGKAGGKSEGKAAGKSEGKGKQGGASTQGETATPPVQDVEDKTPHLLYSQTLSTEVAKVEGVVGGIVLLDDHHRAYVAVNSEAGSEKEKEGDKKIRENKKLSVKTEGKVPPPMSEAIAKTLRKADPLVADVNITSDPGHVKSFQRYATQISTGEVSQLNTQALAEHIEDIWK